MNLKRILSGSIALLTLSVAARADVEILITGATAFRTAAMNAIKAQYDIGNSGVDYDFAHNAVAGSFNAADRVTFKGKFPGVAGITTIRCSWNGSVEGVRAVAVPNSTNNPFFITDAALASPGLDAGEGLDENANVGGSTVQQAAKFSFSDVRQSSTPISSPTLEPADAKVGVVVFSMIVNEGAPAGFLNVSFQQFKALFSGGFLPASVFTGDPANTNNVYATGRNDGSGTRTTYMAESGLGITTLVSQSIALTNSGDNITSIQRVPAGGVNDSDPVTSGIQPYPGQATGNASTVWSQDLDGNGGYVSGSSLRTAMGRTSNNVTVRDADYSILDGPVNIHLLTFLSNPDALTARTNGGRILGWNGSKMDSLTTGTTLTLADRQKVTHGQYSAWSFQQLYYNGSLSTDENAVYGAIKGGIDSTLIAAGYVPGIPSVDMQVTRSDDGAPIAP